MVGLSGGVDSAVSAALLQRAGADVVGAFIKTWTPDPSTVLGARCGWKEERRDAMRVAAHLDIPFVTIDLEREYKESVVDYMISEYKAGRTPNPDVMCNKEIKFGAFLRKALALGADMIATGHYAQVTQSSKVKSQNYSSKLKRGTDEKKDQSYFLWTLTQDQLGKTIFPVGHLMKSEVRELAKKFKLPVAEKRDSQGICFLGHIDMRQFLSHYTKTECGNVLNLQGKKVGEHDGAIFYTLGQKVLGQYVVAKNVEKNELTVSIKRSNTSNIPNAQTDVVKIKDINWIDPSCKLQIANSHISALTAQLRYHGEKLLCHIVQDPHRVWTDECMVKFDQPVLVAPGQSIVFYRGDECLGGGVVE